MKFGYDNSLSAFEAVYDNTLSFFNAFGMCLFGGLSSGIHIINKLLRKFWPYIFPLAKMFDIGLQFKGGGEERSHSSNGDVGIVMESRLRDPLAGRYIDECNSYSSCDLRRR